MRNLKTKTILTIKPKWIHRYKKQIGSLQGQGVGVRKTGEVGSNYTNFHLYDK